MNPDYETRIFTEDNIDWECSTISRLMGAEVTRIKELVGTGNFTQAALLFLQLTKSMCIHFISDEHWSEFDDFYSPEYDIFSLIDFFKNPDTWQKLPADTKTFLSQGWEEILQTEACREYGLLYSK